MRKMFCVKPYGSCKKGGGSDRVEVKMDVEAVFAPSRYVLYLMDYPSGITVRSRQHKLGAEEEKQLTAIMSILCNSRRNLNPTKLPIKRPCTLLAETEEKKRKDSLPILRLCYHLLFFFANKKTMFSFLCLCFISSYQFCQLKVTQSPKYNK